jgi:hypothetical protein
MARGAGQIALVILAEAITGAWAQTPSPRPPLGPADVSRQFPLGLQEQMPSVQSDEISVINLGDAALQFSSWDGEEWKPFKLLPRQTVAIACAKCVNEIPIAFHDGAENRTLNATTGSNYGLFWNHAKRRWDFAPLATILKSRGRFQ